MADVAAAFKPGKELNVFPEQAKAAKAAGDTSANRTEGKSLKRRKPTKREAAEEATRTVFVGNVPVDVRKKAIIQFFRDAVKEALGEAKVAEIAPGTKATEDAAADDAEAKGEEEAAEGDKKPTTKRPVAPIKVAKGGAGIISSVRIRSFGVAEKIALAPGATYKHLLKAAYITNNGSAASSTDKPAEPSADGADGESAAADDADASDDEDEVDIAGATAAAQAAATESVAIAKSAAAAAKGDKAAARAADAAAAAAAAAASANAYVVFTHVDFAKAALECSGKMLGSRHIRVDAVRVPGVKSASADGEEGEGAAAAADTASGFDEKSSLFLGHLPWALDEEGVWALVGPHVKGGADGIRYVRLLRDRITRRSKGVAYVGLKSQGAVGAVAKLLNGEKVQGRTITASKCLPQTALAAKRRAGVLGKGAAKGGAQGKKGAKRARSGDRTHMGATPGQQATAAAAAAAEGAGDAGSKKKKARSAGAKVAASARRSAAKRKAGSNSGVKAVAAK